ncbi:hypothetical protein [Vibrio crassostreae]|uniref:hypothetical protein n=1 Tax=Vibrio crassostreae TaxID=246167 RepID=UPI001B30EEC5|nr:hypothetical protein [Vibrio crassostreae]
MNKMIKNGLPLSVAALSGCAELHTVDYKDNKEANLEFKEQIDHHSEKNVLEVESGIIADDFYTEIVPVNIPMNKNADIPDHIPSTIDYFQLGAITEREFKHTMLTDYGINITFSRLIEDKGLLDDEPEAEENTEAEEQGIVFDPFNPTPTPTEPEDKNDAIETDVAKLFAGEKPNIDHDDYIRPIDFSGSISDFFEIVANDRGLSWKFDETSGEFVFYDLDTIVFDIIDNTDTYESELSISTSSGGQASSEEGSSTNDSTTDQSLTFSEEAKHWEGVENTVNALLTQFGSASFDQKNGKIIVTDTKLVLSKVDKVINTLNEASGAMVYLDINYVKVQLNKTSKIGVELTATDIISSSAVNAGLTTTNPLDTMQSILSLDFNKAGVNAMIGSIQEYGSISTHYEMPISTMNNTPHPYQTVIEEKYVSEVSREESDSEEEDAQDTFTATTEYNKTGLTSLFKPRIIKDEVVVEGRLSLTENIAMVEVESMGNIMLPTNTGETHVIKSKIPNGVTRIVSIQKLTKRKANTSGPAGENSFLAGGNEETENSEELALIMVTPYIIK